MHTFVLERFSDMYDRLDSIMITDKQGVIEYSALFNDDDKSVKNEGYTGKNILDVYPELTEETSSHYRAVKYKKPIIDEVQCLTDINGKCLRFLSSTYPIIMDGEVIGAIEGTVYLSSDGEPYRKETNKYFKNTPKPGQLYCLDDIITADERMEEIKERVERIAAGESFVMICGETGTGKELVAQSLHTHSARHKHPFISQNCAAIPAGLLESTLFGTTRGSYTGAEDKKGLFELANNGTLFLDEVNSMEISLQGKILKAIEEQKIRRIGDEKEIKINVRVVSAMNEKPEEAVAEGRLREDLFYRLGVVQIRLPKLSERKTDIQILTRHFIEKYNQETGKHVKACSELVKKAFMNYPWYGNIRELRNAIEYAFNMVQGDEITIGDIPEHILYEKNNQEQNNMSNWFSMMKEGTPLTSVVNEFEKMIISEIVKENPTPTEAARALNITRQALNYKLQKYNIKL
ncbi:MAG: sigma 54-interacting transcriptional regulator [Eubacteriaceae bacterium]|nr:sigma 54-interacting transcriptional regulator [Eubacteriaceae bacterium]